MAYASECVPLSMCGNGVQGQKVECIVQYVDKAHEPQVVENKECHKAKVGRKPAREVPCYSHCSTVRWVYSGWTKVGLHALL